MTEDDLWVDGITLPEDEDDVIDIAGAETDEEKAVALTQARLIGDL